MYIRRCRIIWWAIHQKLIELRVHLLKPIRDALKGAMLDKVSLVTSPKSITITQSSPYRRPFEMLHAPMQLWGWVLRQYGEVV
jgi:hypothetical protein